MFQERYVKEMIFSFGQIEELRIKLESETPKSEAAADHVWTLALSGTVMEANRLAHQQEDWPQGKTKESFSFNTHTDEGYVTFEGTFTFNHGIPAELFKRNLQGNVLPALIQATAYYSISEETSTSLISLVPKPLDSIFSAASSLRDSVFGLGQDFLASRQEAKRGQRTH